MPNASSKPSVIPPHDSGANTFQKRCMSDRTSDLLIGAIRTGRLIGAIRTGRLIGAIRTGAIRTGFLLGDIRTGGEAIWPRFNRLPVSSTPTPAGHPAWVPCPSS